MDFLGKVSIFEYTSPQEYLREVFNARRTARPNFSLRQFASFLGFSDSGTLSRILNEHRALSIVHAQRIATKLQLVRNEKLYFFQMVLMQEVSDEVRSPLMQELRSVFATPSLRQTKLEDRNLKVVSNWYSLAIRECLRLKSLGSNVVESLKHLWALETPDFDLALKDLEQAGLIQINDGEVAVLGSEHFVISPEKSHQAIQQYHSGWLGVARRAIKDLPVSERSVHGTTLSVPAWAYEEVVQRVTKLHQELLALSAPSEADQILHVGSFVVPVSKRLENKEFSTTETLEVKT